MKKKGSSFPLERSSTRRYAVAVAAVAAGLVLRLALQRWLGGAVPFITYFAVILLSARYGGIGPGLLTTGCSLLAVRLTMPRAENPTTEALSLILFGAISAILCWMIERLNGAQQDAADAIERLNASLAERDEAARALEISSRLNEEILASISDGVIGIDTGWRYTYVNERAARMLHKTTEELLGAVVWEVFPDARNSASHQRMSRAMSDRTVEHWEDHFELLQLWSEVTVYPAANGITVCMRDLTQERSVATALAQSEHRYRALFETTLDGIAVVDNDGVYVEVNESYARKLRTTIAALRGARIQDAIIGGQDAIRQLAAAGTLATHLPARAADGSTVELEWRARANILPHLHLWVARDVSERERLMAQLAQERTTLKLLIEQLPSAVIVADRDGRLTLNNERVAQIWRHDFIPAESVEGYREYRGFHPNGRQYEAAEWPLARALAGERIRDEEIEIQRGDGTRGFITNSAAPLHGADDSIAGAVVVFDDITDRRRLDEQLRQTAKLESLGVLAGGIAHDFNNLLVGILGNASLLEDEVGSAKGRERLAEVARASQRLADLTRQLLAYAGKGRLEMRALDLSTLVREISELIKASIPKSVHVRLELGEGLPAVLADAGQVQQVIMNLVINAAEAIPDGRDGMVLVTTRVQEVDAAYTRTHFTPDQLGPGRYCTVEVQDNGIGMDTATMGRIFDPFFTTKFTGRGLGLAAVLGIINGHGGALRVYSAPGQGSTFRVLLPASEATVAKVDPGPDDDVRGTGTILVVDDDPVVRTVAKQALERYGYTVMLAEGGAEAVAAYRSRRADVVVLDLTMPGMDGEETLRALQTVDPAVRVLLSSGYNEVEAVRHFAGKALAGFIQKPYTAKALARTVHRAMARN